MREFTESDIEADPLGRDRLYVFKDDLVHSPLGFMRQGRMETATGYGKRLRTPYMVRFNGRLYRIRCAVFGNVGTCWFTFRCDGVERTVIVDIL